MTLKCDSASVPEGVWFKAHVKSTLLNSKERIRVQWQLSILSHSRHTK